MIRNIWNWIVGHWRHLVILIIALTVVTYFLYPSVFDWAPKPSSTALRPTDEEILDIDIYGFYEVDNISVHKDLYEGYVRAVFDVTPLEYDKPVEIRVHFFNEHYLSFMEEFKKTGSGTIELIGRAMNKPRRMRAGGILQFPVTRKSVDFQVMKNKKLTIVKGIEIVVNDSQLLRPVEKKSIKVTGKKVKEVTLNLKNP